MMGLLVVLSISLGIALGFYLFQYMFKSYYKWLAIIGAPYLILYTLSTNPSSSSEFVDARIIYFLGLIAFLITYVVKEKIEMRRESK